jgi:hypothetical protein
LLIPIVLFSLPTRAQAGDSIFKTLKFFSYDSLHQTDIADVGQSIFRKKNSPRVDTGKASQVHVSVLPAVGYSLQTGFAAILSVNIAFYNGINALWSYNWFTFGGKPPYLLLPSTGWDSHVNTCRGFIQGRYRGSNMLYLESEYRFLITSNGLFGGVVFANAETFPSRESTLEGNASFKTFDPIQPG